MNCGELIRNSHDPFAAIRREFERGLPGQAMARFGGVTVSRNGDGYCLSFDLPGMAEDQIEMVFEDGVLTISGERSRTVPDDAAELRNTRYFGPFRRSFKMDDSIDPESIDAVLQNGVLTVQLKKCAERQPRRISIRASEKS